MIQIVNTRNMLVTRGSESYTSMALFKGKLYGIRDGKLYVLSGKHVSYKLTTGSIRLKTTSAIKEVYVYPPPPTVATMVVTSDAGESEHDFSRKKVFVSKGHVTDTLKLSLRFQDGEYRPTAIMVIASPIERRVT